MRVFIECDDLLEVLSPVLDHIRRMGIEIGTVTADAGKAKASLELAVVEADRSVSNTLRRRISLIEGVSSVSMRDELEPHLPRRDRVAPSAEAGDARKD